MKAQTAHDFASSL